MDFIFNIFPVLFVVVFVFILGVFVFIIVGGITNRVKNAHAPRLMVEATIITKRMAVRDHTWYFITFQVESGDRMEFSVSDTEYGMLAEGDHGTLQFQGTRFITFERKNI